MAECGRVNVVISEAHPVFAVTRLGQDSIQNYTKINTGVQNKPADRGRSAECASFISAFFVLHKEPTQPVAGCTRFRGRYAGAAIAGRRAERCCAEEWKAERESFRTVGWTQWWAHTAAALPSLFSSPRRSWRTEPYRGGIGGRYSSQTIAAEEAPSISGCWKVRARAAVCCAKGRRDSVCALILG